MLQEIIDRVRLLSSSYGVKYGRYLCEFVWMQMEQSRSCRVPHKRTATLTTWNTLSPEHRMCGNRTGLELLFCTLAVVRTTQDNISSIRTTDQTESAHLNNSVPRFLHHHEQLRSFVLDLNFLSAPPSSHTANCFKNTTGFRNAQIRNVNLWHILSCKNWENAQMTKVASSAAGRSLKGLRTWRICNRSNL
jgi:hypothetical protein